MSPLESPHHGTSHSSASCPSRCHRSDPSQTKIRLLQWSLLPEPKGWAGRLPRELGAHCGALLIPSSNLLAPKHCRFLKGLDPLEPCSLAQQHCWHLSHKFRCHLLPVLGDEPCHQFAGFLLSECRVFQVVYSHLWHAFFFLVLRKLSFMLKFPDYL